MAPARADWKNVVTEAYGSVDWSVPRVALGKDWLISTARNKAVLSSPSEVLQKCLHNVLMSRNYGLMERGMASSTVFSSDCSSTFDCRSSSIADWYPCVTARNRAERPPESTNVGSTLLRKRLSIVRIIAILRGFQQIDSSICKRSNNTLAQVHTEGLSEMLVCTSPD